MASMTCRTGSVLCAEESVPVPRDCRLSRIVPNLPESLAEITVLWYFIAIDGNPLYSPFFCNTQET
jgi:hypothetical protein